MALAGHGVQFRDSEASESYFCPADARLGDRSSLISLTEIHRALEKCRAAFKLLLVDACRNDPLTSTSRDAGGRAVVDLPSLSRPIGRRPPGGVATLFSCSAGEIAFENTELKHGVFFHFVIKGLEGEADGDGDGKVDLLELSDYTTKRVFQFVDNTFGREQTPELLNQTRGSVAIVELHQPRPAPASTPPEPASPPPASTPPEPASPPPASTPPEPASPPPASTPPEPASPPPASTPPEPASPPQIERDRPAAELSWDTEPDRIFAEFLRDKSRGMVRKAAVGIDAPRRSADSAGSLGCPRGHAATDQEHHGRVQHDFPDRPITLSVYDPNGNPILKASYRPGEGVHYQIARDGAATRRDDAEPGRAAGADPPTRKGVTEADRRFAEWAEEHGHAFLRYVQADLERNGRLWFGVTRDVKPEDVPQLTKSLLQGSQKDFPGRDLVATVFDPEGERIGQAHLGADGQVRWDR